MVALLVNQALFLGDTRHALACSEALLRTTGPRISAALATDVYAMQAGAYARLGDRRSAHDCMRRAEAYSERIRPAEEPEETSYVQPGLVEVRLAEALILLGELSAAAEYAQRAARAPAHARGRVNRLATLTDVALHAGEPERAAVTAAEMVDTAQGIESQRLRGRMRRVRKRLEQHPRDFGGRSGEAHRGLAERAVLSRGARCAPVSGRARHAGMCPTSVGKGAHTCDGRTWVNTLCTRTSGFG